MGERYADAHTRHRISESGYRISMQYTGYRYSIQILVPDTGTDVIYWIQDAATDAGNDEGCIVGHPRPHGSALPYRAGGVRCRASPYYLPLWLWGRGDSGFPPVCSWLPDASFHLFPMYTHVYISSHVSIPESLPIPIALHCNTLHCIAAQSSR